MIDAHLHLWDPRRLSYPWLANAPEISGLHDPEAWSAAQTGVRRAIFVQSDCLADQALDEVDWVDGLDHPSLAVEGIVAFAPLELGEGVADHLSKLLARPRVRGVRRLLQGETDAFITSADHVAGLIAAARADLTIDLCVTARQLASVLVALDALIAAEPTARVVLDHLGKPDIAAHGADIHGDEWAQMIRELADRSNLFAKVSGLTTQDTLKAPRAEAIRPYIDHALTCFGPDRLMFGGDWPVVDLAGGYGLWRSLFETAMTPLSPKDQARIRSGSAKEFYRIDRAATPAARETTQ
jgi:L-fuconolactonase